MKPLPDALATPRQPVLVLQHQSSDGPAYLAHWLRVHSVPIDVRNAQAGDPHPPGVAGHYSALAILGGEMSANDELPNLRRDEALFLEAVKHGIPTLGHCLGGQLMARALGARVTASPQPEVGWHEIDVDPASLAQVWFGAEARQTVFQWHYEAFELPSGAQRLAASAACPNQAFAFGPHLAMQFHVELDAAKLDRWLGEVDERYFTAMAAHPTVQSPQRMRGEALRGHARQQQLADRVYRRWLSNACERERRDGIPA